MRKILILFAGIASFLGVNTVKADTLVSSSYYEKFDESITFYLENKDLFDNLVSDWQSNYSSQYPYYSLSKSSYLYTPDNTEYNTIQLTACSSNKTEWDNTYISSADDSSCISIKYDFRTKDTSYNSNAKATLYSSFGGILLNHGFIYNNVPSSWSQGGTVHTSDYDLIKFPAYTSSKYNNSFLEFEVKEGDLLPSYLDLYNGTYNPIKDNYTEINLNDYSYVALSLKDYSTVPENNYSVYTNMYVKGQLCITPVYNYGNTERKDVLTGSQVQGCSQYYNDFTLTRMYILKDDVENHAIYYLKAYDKTKANLVKVDTSVFNISLITEEQKDNPSVSINGKDYPTIPYDQLTDTSTKSEEEGYIPGVSCAVGDFNCYNKYNSSNVFDEVFKSPLDFLKSIWSSVTSIFTIIAEFISLLPVTMQSFLYLSFMVAIILGLLKILL